MPEYKYCTADVVGFNIRYWPNGKMYVEAGTNTLTKRDLLDMLKEIREEEKKNTR